MLLDVKLLILKFFSQAVRITGGICNEEQGNPVSQPLKLGGKSLLLNMKEKVNSLLNPATSEDQCPLLGPPSSPPLSPMVFSPPPCSPLVLSPMDLNSPKTPQNQGVFVFPDVSGVCELPPDTPLAATFSTPPGCFEKGN